MSRIKCPACRKSLSLEEAAADARQIGRCPSCGQRFRVPTASATAPAAPATPAKPRDFDEINELLNGMASMESAVAVPESPAPRGEAAPGIEAASRLKPPSAKPRLDGILEAIPVGIPVQPESAGETNNVTVRTESVRRAPLPPTSPRQPRPAPPPRPKKKSKEARQLDEEWAKERLFSTVVTFFSTLVFGIVLTLITLAWPEAYAITAATGLIVSLAGVIWFLAVCFAERPDQGMSAFIPVFGPVRYLLTTRPTEAWKPFIVKIGGILIAGTTLLVGLLGGGMNDADADHDELRVPKHLRHVDLDDF